MASHGQPSRNEPSGPLLVHFLQPMQRMGSTWMRPNGGWSSSGTQNMQSSIGQYSTQAGEPAQPVQHSVMTASSLGFLRRTVSVPTDLGSNFSSSGTIPTALASAILQELYLRFTSQNTSPQRQRGAEKTSQSFPICYAFQRFSLSLCASVDKSLLSDIFCFQPPVPGS